jgi:hypothetical protein
MVEQKPIPVNLNNIDFTKRLHPCACRKDKLEVLKQYYLRFMCEDWQDGTDLDCDVLHAIEALQKKYENNEGL